MLKSISIVTITKIYRKLQYSEIAFRHLVNDIRDIINYSSIPSDFSFQFAQLLLFHFLSTT